MCCLTQVATRNDALDQVVQATPAERRKDLVWMQNGMLAPWLDARGLGDSTQVSSGAGRQRARLGEPAACQRGRGWCYRYPAAVGCSLLGLLQCLIFFAVAKKGDQPIDGRTDTDPDGLTAGGQGTEYVVPACTPTMQRQLQPACMRPASHARCWIALLSRWPCWRSSCGSGEGLVWRIFE